MFHGSQASVQRRVDTNHHPPSNQHLVAASILLQAHQGRPHGHHPVVQQQPPPSVPACSTRTRTAWQAVSQVEDQGLCKGTETEENLAELARYHINFSQGSKSCCFSGSPRPRSPVGGPPHQAMIFNQPKCGKEIHAATQLSKGWLDIPINLSLDQSLVLSCLFSTAFLL